MKIKKIEFKNNEILGDLTIDLTYGGGEIADTVILAGENGSGKTAILKYLYDFTNYSLSPRASTEERIITIQLTDEEIRKLQNSENFKTHFQHGVKDNTFIFHFDFSIIGNWNQIKAIYTDLNGNSKTIPGGAFTHQDAKEVMKSIYSDVEINFNPGNIKNVTAKNIDQVFHGNIKSSPNIATEITQLLIDVQALDDAEFTEWARENKEAAIDQNKLDVRIRRFRDAFDYMFPHMNYKAVRNINNQKKVVFSSNGKEIPIDVLSSGEKQIVFRGGFLLKDQKSTKGALILIDEPEISLHPLWQLKIVPFLTKLFTDDAGNQTSQIIIATHSPFIIHNSTRHNDKVIVLNRRENGKITIADRCEFHGWTTEKQVEEAFNIELYIEEGSTSIFVEGETDEKYLCKAIEVFDKAHLNFKVKWIGRTNERGNKVFSGDTALNQTKEFFLANPELLKGKVVLLYDCDTNKPNEDHEKLLIRTVLFNDKNLIFKKGFENLLNLTPNFDTTKFHKENNKIDDYGVPSTIRGLDKVKMCNYICDEQSAEDTKFFLQNFDELLNSLGEIVSS